MKLTLVEMRMWWVDIFLPKWNVVWRFREQCPNSWVLSPNASSPREQVLSEAGLLWLPSIAFLDLSVHYCLGYCLYPDSMSVQSGRQCQCHHLQTCHLLPAEISRDRSLVMFCSLTTHVQCNCVIKNFFACVLEIRLSICDNKHWKIWLKHVFATIKEKYSIVMQLVCNEVQKHFPAIWNTLSESSSYDNKLIIKDSLLPLKQNTIYSHTCRIML